MFFFNSGDKAARLNEQIFHFWFINNSKILNYFHFYFIFEFYFIINPFEI
jgi:hypothetical protein